MAKRAGSLLDNLEERIHFFQDLGVEYLSIAPGEKQPLPLPLRERILGCRRCPLSQGRTHVVPGEGNEQADLMFVGEAPGRDEDIQGRPFVGRAGQLLTRIIEAMQFKREQVFITNVVKCRPPENRTPASEEIKQCNPFLLEQIETIRPRVIVALGKVAADLFIQSGLNITLLRGNFHEFKGIQVMPTFHPSYLVRNEGNRELRKMVWEDMRKVMAFLGKR